jgi:hypothetical protein
MSLDSSNAVIDWNFTRGRRRQLDHTEAAQASLTLQNHKGLFDTTNDGSPYYGYLEPLIPAAINVKHPFTDEQHTLFTGYIEDWGPYERPSKGRKRETLTVPLVDGFELLTQAKVKPSSDPGHEGSLHYAPQHVDDRIKAAAADADWPAARTNIFHGNVDVQESSYSPGTSMLEVMQDAADAEFPDVANLWMGKQGEIEFRGRYDRFTRAAAGIPEWVLGDDWGLGEDDTRVPIFLYTWAFEKQFIVNSCLVTPIQVDPADVPGMRVEAPLSIAKYGRRDRDIQGLLTLRGDDGNTGGEECQAFASYIVSNNKQPHVHVYGLEIHSTMGQAAWDFIVGVQISSLIELWTQHVGGGGFNGRQFFVEGISAHSTGTYSFGVPDIVMTLDLSPKERWTSFA